MSQAGQRSVRDGDAGRQPIGPGLRVVLGIVAAATLMLAATGYFLSAVRASEWLSGRPAAGPLALWVFMVHVVVGLAATAPFVVFGLAHWRRARCVPNPRAAARGRWVFGLGLAVVLTGGLLIQLDGLPELRAGSAARVGVLALHAIVPLAAAAMYAAHRQAAGRRAGGIAWLALAGSPTALAAFVTLAGASSSSRLPAPPEPLQQVVEATQRQAAFAPSAARTADGRHVAANALMMDDYCLRCHADVHRAWSQSAHRFSSFNNPVYRASVRETRATALQRDGHAAAVRWCAGCHDPVPLLSGALDGVFDDVSHPTAHAGITCVVCHAVSDVPSAAGNGGYTITLPQHYPFATSRSETLQWLSGQLVRAKPDFHRRSFLKPLHQTAEFCAACHKVSIPPEVSHFKDFFRGQNHYDSFLLSGVSGHSARSFSYPDRAHENCASCHMPTVPSRDPAARDVAGAGVRTVHDHLFPGANTALPLLCGCPDAVDRHADFLRGTRVDGSDQPLAIDLFGLKEDGRTDGRLHAPLRPHIPAVEPGRTYLVEVVLRTQFMGHHFTQGTADSNEVWVEFTAAADGVPFAASGRMTGPGDAGAVDPWAHRINALLVDRDGNRIARRNVQDVVAAVYDHQIPPGAAAVVHYRLEVPADATCTITLTARVRYRKFDDEIMRFVARDGGAGTAETPAVLPVVDLCTDAVTLPVAENADPGEQPDTRQAPALDQWKRWNDYGIGCLLEGGAEAKRGELRQAEAAFREVTAVPAAAAHGWINLARLFVAEGRHDEAASALDSARQASPPAAWWLVEWLTATVVAEQAGGAADVEQAIACLERILDPANQPRSRGFDFTADYVVRLRLADVLLRRGLIAEAGDRERWLRRAVGEYERVLESDPEQADAHYGLAQCHARLAGSATSPLAAEAKRLATAPFAAGSPRLPALGHLLERALAERAAGGDPAVLSAGLAAVHRVFHAALRPDEQAAARAVARHRAENPAADLAAEPVPVYPLSPVAAPPASTAGAP